MDNMTPTDKKRYDLMLERLRFWQNERLLKNHVAAADKTEVQQVSIHLADVIERVENLEQLLFFELCNSAGEQGLTPELKLLMKTTGYWDLFVEFQKIIHTIK